MGSVARHGYRADPPVLARTVIDCAVVPGRHRRTACKPSQSVRAGHRADPVGGAGGPGTAADDPDRSSGRVLSARRTRSCRCPRRTLSDVAARTASSSPPRAFTRALASLRSARVRSELVYEEVPAPQRVAPYAVAVSGDVVVGGEELATGRLIVLHDPDGHDAWEGTFRCVAYLRAEIEAEVAADPLLGQVAWTWLTEALDGHEAGYSAPSGTVTRVVSEGFGGMADEPQRAEMELRASWTPTSELAVHLAAWGDLLCTAAGLPPVPPGVVPMPSRSGTRRARRR